MDISGFPGYVELIEAALDPDDTVTLALAGVIALAAQRPAPYDVAAAGLDACALAALQRRYFPDLAWPLDAGVAGQEIERSADDEFADLVALLMEYRGFPGEESEWLAHAIATACMGANHLWQDLGLPGRKELSLLMQHHFPALAARNRGDMRWKKFLYRELCERAEVRLCKAPSCAECSDFRQCFP